MHTLRWETTNTVNILKKKMTHFWIVQICDIDAEPKNVDKYSDEEGGVGDAVSSGVGIVESGDLVRSLP